ncbi:MAG: N-acetyltransferase family protein [Chloroflexota bacterium]
MTALDDPTRLTLTLPVTIREACQEDIPRLEWYGQYKHFRNLLRRAYKEQRAGRRLLLVADLNGFPIGQLFVQLIASNRRIADGHTRAYLYSFRVMELFQGQGIGTLLLSTAEQRLARLGYHHAMIAVAKDNPRAQRLYERRGYTLIGEDPGRWRYVDHKGVTREVNEPCWILEKLLESG